MGKKPQKKEQDKYDLEEAYKEFAKDLKKIPAPTLHQLIYSMAAELSERESDGGPVISVHRECDCFAVYIAREQELVVSLDVLLSGHIA